MLVRMLRPGGLLYWSFPSTSASIWCPATFSGACILPCMPHPRTNLVPRVHFVGALAATTPLPLRPCGCSSHTPAHANAVLGARQLLADAGLEVVHTQRMGDSMITSGYMLGFGTGDYAHSYLEKHMLVDVGSNVQWLNAKKTSCTSTSESSSAKAKSQLRYSM